MNKVKLFTCVVVSLGMWTTAAAQQIVDATDPEGLTNIIRDLGYKAIFTTDGVGDPMIESSVGGTDITIFFYGCDDGENCTSLLYKVGYDLEDGTTLRVINDWNETSLFGRAYLDDEGDPWVEMPVNMLSGVSRKNFEDTYDWWEIVVSRFENHIDF